MICDANIGASVDDAAVTCDADHVMGGVEHKAIHASKMVMDELSLPTVEVHSQISLQSSVGGNSTKSVQPQAFLALYLYQSPI